MDYEEFHARWASCLGDGDYEQAFAMLRPMLQDGTEHQGFALGLKALGLYTTSPRNASESLRLTREALSLVGDNPILKAKTLINGLGYATYISDNETSKAFSLSLRAVMMNPIFDSSPWMGRCLLALGRHYELIENFATAVQYFDEARKWHTENVGPYSESDRLCYLGVATACHIELQLLHGNLKGTDPSVSKAVRLIRTSKRPYLADYIEALVHHRLGDFAEAVSAYTVAIDGAKARRDHAHRLRVTIALATVYKELGRYEDARSILHPLIRECALGRLVFLVSQLQWFLQTLPREEVCV